ncbi:MAG: hypothetical protein FWF45_00985 [Coriobacteriia bacterium]|nr:hypothetical protein [Coriobacteriia bacterium]
MFKVEYDYYKANRAELIKKYPNKFLVIKGKSIEGVFDTALEAVKYADDRFGAGKAMIQMCDPRTDAYPVRIASAFPIFV